MSLSIATAIRESIHSSPHNVSVYYTCMYISLYMAVSATVLGIVMLS